MIQVQSWALADRIIITDEQHHGSIQAEIPKGEYKKEYYFDADCCIHNLWVDEPYRRQGVARLLLEAAENELKKRGCKRAELRWDHREASLFVLKWYLRSGYREAEHHETCSYLIKDLK